VLRPHLAIINLLHTSVSPFRHRGPLVTASIRPAQHPPISTALTILARATRTLYNAEAVNYDRQEPRSQQTRSPTLKILCYNANQITEKIRRFFSEYATMQNATMETLIKPEYSGIHKECFLVGIWAHTEVFKHSNETCAVMLSTASISHAQMHVISNALRCPLRHWHRRGIPKPSAPPLGRETRQLSYFKVHSKVQEWSILRTKKGPKKSSRAKTAL